MRTHTIQINEEWYPDEDGRPVHVESWATCSCGWHYGTAAAFDAERAMMRVRMSTEVDAHLFGPVAR